jgi:hypothetical protein|tara:strand:+ start:177 stop:572 length:396 start_codon:yes stop_codon:yes gene_type:complete
MEEDFYATIKFKSGEEIFARVGYSEEEDRTFLLLESPITIEKVKNRTGAAVYAYKVEPWLKTSKDDIFVVNLEDVLTLNESNDVETIAMHEAFSKQQDYTYKPEKKLNRKMGYISTIKEAKKSLEKLYNKS